MLGFMEFMARLPEAGKSFYRDTVRIFYLYRSKCVPHFV